MSKQSKELKDLAKKIYTLPGEEPRWVYAVEEMSELIKELMKRERVERRINFDETDKIVEEACDVIFTVWMMLDYWGIDKKDIYDHMIAKCKRTITNSFFKAHPAQTLRYPVTVGPAHCALGVSIIGSEKSGQFESMGNGQMESIGKGQME